MINKNWFICHMKLHTFIQWLIRKWWKSRMMISFGDNSENNSLSELTSREGKYLK